MKKARRASEMAKSTHRTSKDKRDRRNATPTTTAMTITNQTNNRALFNRGLLSDGKMRKVNGDAAVSGIYIYGGGGLC